MRISDWSSDVCSSDLRELGARDPWSPIGQASAAKPAEMGTAPNLGSSHTQSTRRAHRSSPSIPTRVGHPYLLCITTSTRTAPATLSGDEKLRTASTTSGARIFNVKGSGRQGERRGGEQCVSKGRAG